MYVLSIQSHVALRIWFISKWEVWVQNWFNPATIIDEPVSSLECERHVYVC
jgi:hypothetical protein